MLQEVRVLDRLCCNVGNWGHNTKIGRICSRNWKKCLGIQQLASCKRVLRHQLIVISDSFANVLFSDALLNRLGQIPMFYRFTLLRLVVTVEVAVRRAEVVSRTRQVQLTTLRRQLLDVRTAGYHRQVRTRLIRLPSAKIQQVASSRYARSTARSSHSCPGAHSSTSAEAAPALVESSELSTTALALLLLSHRLYAAQQMRLLVT